MDVWLNDHVMFFYRRWCKYPWLPKSARLRNTTDPFWWLLEMYSNDRAQHNDADIIGREVGGVAGWPPSWHSERLQLPGERRRGRFHSSSAKTWKALFIYLFFWCREAEGAISQTQLRKKKPVQTRCWLLGACFFCCNENVLTLRLSPTKDRGSI